MRFTRWISTVDTHTEGQATRIVTGGVPPLPGATMADKLTYFKQHFDSLRTSLIAEPRGHRDMYGCILTAPACAGADFGAFFMHNSGYMNMCGHATIGLCTALFELGLAHQTDDNAKVVLDTPAGTVTAHAVIRNGRVGAIAFRNSPSFALQLDQTIDVPGIGNVSVDLAYGGNFFVFFSATDAGIEISRTNVNAIVAVAMQIRASANARFRVSHPLYGPGEINVATILGPGETPDVTLRNVHVFGPGQFDRSPGGTGTSALLAMLHAKGRIGLDDTVAIESLTGGRFRGRILAETRIRDQVAVETEVEGSAYVTGCHQFWIDPDDRLGPGFLFPEL